MRQDKRHSPNWDIYSSKQTVFLSSGMVKGVESFPYSKTKRGNFEKRKRGGVNEKVGLYHVLESNKNVEPI